MLGTYKVGSMFAGIGGICLAFKNAGAKIVWANEIDKNACITYRYNFRDSYLNECDVRELVINNIPNFDILAAGFPCQSFSVAGYQDGFDDERGNMFFEIIRIAKAKNPRIIFLENVKNLISHDNGNTFDIIKRSLENEGYYIKYKVINTMEYGNIPQNRERVYIIGFLNKEEYSDFVFPEPVELTRTIKDIIDMNEKKDECFYYNNTKYYNELKKAITNDDTVYQIRRVYIRENKNKVCPTLTANMGTGGHNVPIIKDNYDIRKITPDECLLFQGFDKAFKFPETMKKTNAYKQVGNSVSVPVVKRIADNIIKTMIKYDRNKI